MKKRQVYEGGVVEKAPSLRRGWGTSKKLQAYEGGTSKMLQVSEGGVVDKAPSLRGGGRRQSSMSLGGVIEKAPNLRGRSFNHLQVLGVGEVVQKVLSLT